MRLNSIIVCGCCAAAITAFTEGPGPETLCREAIAEDGAEAVEPRFRLPTLLEAPSRPFLAGDCRGLEALVAVGLVALGLAKVVLCCGLVGCAFGAGACATGLCSAGRRLICGLAALFAPAAMGIKEVTVVARAGRGRGLTAERPGVVADPLVPVPGRAAPLPGIPGVDVPAALGLSRGLAVGLGLTAERCLGTAGFACPVGAIGERQAEAPEELWPSV